MQINDLKMILCEAAGGLEASLASFSGNLVDFFAEGDEADFITRKRAVKQLYEKCRILEIDFTRSSASLGLKWEDAAQISQVILPAIRYNLGVLVNIIDMQDGWSDSAASVRAAVEALREKSTELLALVQGTAPIQLGAT